MWNAVNYFKDINSKLKLTVDGKYHFARITGITFLEDILSNLKSQQAYLAVDDTDDGVTVRKGGAYFTKRVVTVYVLRKYKIADQQDRETKLAECRLIRDKLEARIIKDTNTVADMMYVDKTRFPYREVPGYFAAGTCGIYFFITIEEPKNLCYDGDDYISDGPQ